MKSKEWIHHREPSQQGLQVWRALIPIDDGERARRKHHSDFERAAWCWNRSIIDRSNIIHIRALLGKVPTNVWVHQFCQGSRIYSILRQRVFKKQKFSLILLPKQVVVSHKPFFEAASCSTCRDDSGKNEGTECVSMRVNCVSLGLTRGANLTPLLLKGCQIETPCSYKGCPIETPPCKGVPNWDPFG